MRIITLFYKAIAVTGIASFFFIFSGCGTPPRIMIFGNNLYYLPTSVWKTGDAKNILLRMDISHLFKPTAEGDKEEKVKEETEENERKFDVIVNMSFINKKEMPQSVSSEITITADNKVYLLEDVRLMFRDIDINAYRITSYLIPEDFRSICQSNVIVITATVDGVTYQFTPPKEFFHYKEQYIRYAPN